MRVRDGVNRISRPQFISTKVGPRPKRCPHCQESGLRLVYEQFRASMGGHNNWCYVCGHRFTTLTSGMTTHSTDNLVDKWLNRLYS